MLKTYKGKFKKIIKKNIEIGFLDPDKFPIGNDGKSLSVGNMAILLNEILKISKASSTIIARCETIENFKSITKPFGDIQEILDENILEYLISGILEEEMIIIKASNKIIKRFLGRELDINTRMIS